MRIRPRKGRWRAAAVTALVLVVGACGSRSSPAQPTTTPAVTSAPTTASVTTAAPSTSTVPSATTVANTAPDSAAATAQITANWEKFFQPGASIDERVALLQNGEALRPAIEQNASNPLQQQVSAKVTQVTLTSPTEANVTYDVSLSGTVALPAAQGKALLEGGTWKVAQDSFCSLISLGTTAPIPGCS
jgi:hypothetical protein